MGHGSGLKGLWHAHVGWLWEENGISDAKKYAPDLLEDRGHALHQPPLPAGGWRSAWRSRSRSACAITGTLAGGLLALLWGGLVRIFFVHHITWSINSVCHFFGRRRFDTDDKSTNVFWLALPSLGEAWHHNHHAFPRAAVQGLRWWEIDVSGLVIRADEAPCGLAWNVVRITPERQQQRLASREGRGLDGAAEHDDRDLRRSVFAW